MGLLLLSVGAFDTYLYFLRFRSSRKCECEGKTFPSMKMGIVSGRWEWGISTALNQQKSRVGSRRSRLRRRDGGESREDEINGKETKTDESQTSWLSRQSSTNGEISFLILILCWLLWSSVRSVGILNRDQKLCLHKKNSIASHRTKYVWTCSEA